MDAPIVTVRQGVDAKGAACVVVEVSVEVRRAGRLLLAVDLSDSSPVTEADVARLPRLLAPLPRTWRVSVSGLGTAAAAAAAARWAAPTVGDVVDGVVDLRKTLFAADVLAGERAAGSFLAPVLERFLAAGEPADARLVAVVLTDGRLVDVDPVRVPEGMRVLGLGPDQGPTDRGRWSEIVPGSSFIDRDTERDAIGRLRAATGCGFHGPCVVVVPDGACRMRAAARSTPDDSPPTAERRRPWDFALQGPLVLEFVGAAPPDHLVVEGADGLEARLPLPQPAACAAVETDRGPSPEPAAAPDVVEVVLGPDDARALLQRASELAEARTAWQAADGTLAIDPAGGAVASHVIDEAGRPRADSFVLIGRAPADEPGAIDPGALLLIPARRDSRIDFPPAPAAPGGARFSAGARWSLHFDKRENRWMFSSADAPATPLPPRGSHLLPADVRDAAGVSYRVFFSGPLAAS